MSAPKRINLLKQDGFESSTPGKILTWALSFGRTIVIITELIVIAAFLSRFWLDRQLTDLNDKNKAKTIQIEASSTFENDFRNIQLRLAAYKTIAKQKTNGASLIKEIATRLPADTYLSEFYFSNKHLSLKGLSLSEAGISGFLKALDNSGKFASVKLEDLSLEGAGKQSLRFSVGLEIK